MSLPSDFPVSPNFDFTLSEDVLDKHKLIKYLRKGWHVFHNVRKKMSATFVFNYSCIYSSALPFCYVHGGERRTSLNANKSHLRICVFYVTNDCYLVMLQCPCMKIMVSFYDLPSGSGFSRTSRVTTNWSFCV